MIFRNQEKVAKIVTALDLKILPRDLKSKDTRHLLSLIFSQWLSLSTCVTQAVIDVVPPPSIAQATRIPKMLYPDLYENTLVPRNKLEEDLFTAKAGSDACVTAYVSKMFAVSIKDMPENKKKPVTADEMRNRAREARVVRQAAADVATGADDSVNEPNSSPHTIAEQMEHKKEPIDDRDVILGFARLYSGTIRAGTSVYAVLPKYNLAYAPDHPRNLKYLLRVPVEGLYVMMGRELIPVDFVRAGNTFAIKGLEGKVWRSATLCAPKESGIDGGPDVDGSCLINLGGIDRAVCLPVCIFVVSMLTYSPIHEDNPHRSSSIRACFSRRYAKADQWFEIT
jgi:ribosome assembly protein 1